MKPRQPSYKSSKRQDPTQKRRPPQWMGIAFWSIIALSASALIYAGIAAIAFMPQLQAFFGPSPAPGPSAELTETLAVAAAASATTLVTNSPLPPLATETSSLPPNATATLIFTFTSTPTNLPSFTPAPTDTVSVPPPEEPTATPTFTSTETATATATPTATAEGGGWAFVNIRLTTDPDEADPNVVVYGEIVNNSGADQEIAAITGTFFDAQGLVIAGEDTTTDFWPLEAVAAGERMPFELFVDGISSAASYKLRAESSVTPNNPRQNFELSAVTQTTEAGNYCVSGKVRNPGDALQSYLTIVVTIYNNQNTVINFGSDDKTGLTTFVGDKTVNFKVCITPPNQDVVRYDLRAFGH